MKLAGLEFVEYDEDRHQTKYMDMVEEYSKNLDDEVFSHYSVRLIQYGEIRSLTEKYVPIWASVKPPEGIIYMMEYENEIVGTGRLDTFSEGIGEVHTIWTSPKHRGKGFATRLMKRLEDTAKGFGLTSIRLDTAKFNLPAINLYKKIGYKEISRYRDGVFDNEILRRYYEEKVYMEKQL